MTSPHPFPWRVGMRAIRHSDGVAGRVVACAFGWIEVHETNYCWSPTECRPDPDDGPTRGALLDAVREVWGDPGAYCAPVRTGDGWLVWADDDGQPDSKSSVGHGPTEFAALVAAYNAAPRSTP